MRTVVAALTPLGRPLNPPAPLSPRIETLQGKTVGEVWNGAYDGPITFRVIEEMLRERYPDIRIVPYTAFPLLPLNEMGMEKRDGLLDAVRAALIENRCDALITGNGG